MTIREATEQDIPSIVALLKRSLGENLMPKSEAFWRWKHLANPFGTSPVLLALEDDRIIGVRAFLRWEWIRNGKIFRAVRAVDTATDPDFQSKGIFTKLTMALLDDCKQNGFDFVYNTPNTQSKPGYLKMGWRSVGRLSVTFGFPPNPFQRVKLPKDNSLSVVINIPALDHLIKKRIKDTPGMITHYSKNYLQWRYLESPVIPYYCLHDLDSDAGFFVIFRLKESRWGREFRITEFLFEDNYDKTRLRKQVQDNMKIHNANFAAWASADQLPVWGIPMKLGPECTIHDLKPGKESMIDFSNWKPSLGTLEVF